MDTHLSSRASYKVACAHCGSSDNRTVYEDHSWCFTPGCPQPWLPIGDRKRSSAEIAKLRREREVLASAAQRECRAKWDASRQVVGQGHPYLAKKTVIGYGLRHRKGLLLVPVRDVNGELLCVQTISPSGRKLFHAGSTYRGAAFEIGHPANRVLIAEGVATALSVYEATQECTLAALSANNLEAVARFWHAKYPDVEIILCADHDRKEDGANPGLEAAEQAARTVRGSLAVGVVGDADKMDFNDVHRHHGLAKVRELLAKAEPLAPAPRPKNNLPDTDLANATRFVLQQHDVRFAQGRGWCIWDGKRWKAGADQEAMERAKATAANIYDELKSLPSDDQKTNLFNWARRSQQADRISAMLRLAQSDPIIRLDPAQLDADPMVINVHNGIVNLRTGDLEPHSRRHEPPMSLIAPVRYERGAACPRWTRFLHEVMDGDEEMIQYLQRAVGYILTGLTDEQVLFILLGVGANGKSVFLEVVRTLLGEYAQSMAMETLLPRHGHGATPDLARLVGARVVSISEFPERTGLNEARVKDLTGGDVITARKLYQAPFDFKPTAKFFLRANHRPEIKGTDDGIWRRIQLVPFDVIIPPDRRQPMSELLERFRIELPGILSWAIEGCMEWQRIGLSAPSRVRRATKDYRSKMDIVSQFLTECTERRGGAQVQARALYRAYTEWCDDSGEQHMTERAFADRLVERGVRKERRRDHIAYLGLELKDRRS